MKERRLTIKEAARRAGVPISQAKRLVKWYVLFKGLDYDDVIQYNGPRSYTYSLPEDFVDFVKNYAQAGRVVNAGGKR